MFFIKKKDKRKKCILTLKRFKYTFTVKDGGHYENSTNWIVINNVGHPSNFIYSCFLRDGYILTDEGISYLIHNVTCIETHLLETKMIHVAKENSYYNVLTDKQVTEFSLDE